MPHVYVDSNAGGSGTGADWANAYTTIGAALTAKAAGDNFWVAHNHAETAAGAKTLTSPGTSAAPCTIICVDSGEQCHLYPPTYGRQRPLPPQETTP